jgi:hypothetical protein
VQVGNLLKHVRFYVTPGLGVPCILGCTFINLHVKIIHPKERRVDLNEGGSIAITSCVSACQALATTRELILSNKVRIAQRTVIPARCEAHVDVTTAVSGLCVLIHSSRTQVVSLASGVADVRSNVPFRVRILNPSDRSITLPKGMVIGSASTRPQRIITVNTVVETLLTQGEAVHDTASPMETTEPAPKSWQDDVKLDHLGSEERQSVLRML